MLHLKTLDRRLRVHAFVLWTSFAYQMKSGI